MLFAFANVAGAWASQSILFGRGRGLGRLVAGLMEGDPFAWGMLGVVIVVMVAWYGIKRWMSSEE